MAAYLWRISFRQCVQRLPIDGQRALQLSLIGVQIAELQQRTDAGVLVGGPIAQTGTVQLGALPQDAGRFLAAAERYQRGSKVQIGNCKKMK